MDKEQNEVSLHEVLVWRALGKTWVTHREIHARLKGKVAERTIRAHTKKLVTLGLVDVAEVFPGHRYRAADKAEKRNVAYTQRLQKAAEVFGLVK